MADKNEKKIPQLLFYLSFFLSFFLSSFFFLFLLLDLISPIFFVSFSNCQLLNFSFPIFLVLLRSQHFLLCFLQHYNLLLPINTYACTCTHTHINPHMQTCVCKCLRFHSNIYNNIYIFIYLYMYIAYSTTL